MKETYCIFVNGVLFDFRATKIFSFVFNDSNVCSKLRDKTPKNLCFVHAYPNATTGTSLERDKENIEFIKDLLGEDFEFEYITLGTNMSGKYSFSKEAESLLFFPTKINSFYSHIIEISQCIN